PANEHAAVGGSYPFDRGPQLVDGGRLADHLEADGGAFLEFAHLPMQLGGFQRPRGYQQQPVRLEGLFDIVVGPALDGRHRRLDVAVPGNDHHRQAGVRSLDDVQHLEAVEAAALQPDVENDELRPAFFHRLQGFIGVARDARAMPLVPEQTGDVLANICLVVDDQDVGSHLTLL